MFITEEERIILVRVLQRLLVGEQVNPKKPLTIRERRELIKAQDNGKKETGG